MSSSKDPLSPELWIDFSTSDLVSQFLENEEDFFALAEKQFNKSKSFNSAVSNPKKHSITPIEKKEKP